MIVAAILAAVLLRASVAGASDSFTAPQPPDSLPAPLVEGDIARGQQLFQGVCFACHGVDGAGQQPVGSASLHQQHPWYLVMQLEKFRAGHRGKHPDDVRGQQMQPMSMTLPDEQALSDVALYVTGLDGARPPATLEGDAAAGRKIYEAVCMVCHGAAAEGIAVFHSPALAGQADWYVADAVRKFRDGQRGADPHDATGLQMKTIAAEFTNDEDIVNVATYIATLR